MDNDAIKTTIDHFKEEGRDVRVRDIAYCLLSKMFMDNKTAYQCLFGNADGYEDYANDEMRSKIEEYLTAQGCIRSFSTDADTGSITFEENKEEMVKLLHKTQKALDDGIIEPKDALKIMADIRVKINDKFKVEAKQQERTIIVEKKFSGVCEYCHHEIYVPSKEDLIEMYNLTEKQ